MLKINNVQQLQAYIAKHCLSAVIRSALTEPGGKFEHLGAFKPAPGSSRPGFVSRITTRYGTQYIVAVTVYDFDRYNCYMPDHIDWKCYTGGCNHLYKGDTPKLFNTFKNAERIDNLIESEDNNGKA